MGLGIDALWRLLHDQQQSNEPRRQRTNSSLLTRLEYTRMCTKRQPTHARWCCSLFLRKLKDTLKLPVLALVDSDPYGLKILSVYMKVWAGGGAWPEREASTAVIAPLSHTCIGTPHTHTHTHHTCTRTHLQACAHPSLQGSMNMSYDAANLTTPDIKWLGVRPSDLDRFNIPAQCRLPMTDEDVKTGRKLVGKGAKGVCDNLWRCNSGCILRLCWQPGKPWWVAGIAHASS